MWTDRILFTHPSVTGRLGCVYFLAVLNNAAMNVAHKYLLETCFTSSGDVPRDGSAGSDAGSLFSFWTTPHSSSKVAPPFCFGAHSTQGLPVSTPWLTLLSSGFDGSPNGSILPFFSSCCFFALLQLVWSFPGAGMMVESTVLEPDRPQPAVRRKAGRPVRGQQSANKGTWQLSLLSA